MAADMPTAKKTHKTAILILQASISTFGYLLVPVVR
jgi:hypothetical protein